MSKNWIKSENCYWTSKGKGESLLKFWINSPLSMFCSHYTYLPGLAPLFSLLSPKTMHFIIRKWNIQHYQTIALFTPHNHLV